MIRAISDCSHFPHQPQAAPTTESCADCGLQGPIRLCLTCGQVGCCDSTNGHATAHSKATGHPVIRELPLSERSFAWCYECRLYLR